MRIGRHAGAAILYGGWLLLFNPNEHAPTASLATWKKVHEYDTPYLCEQGRREEISSALEREAKHGGGSRMRPEQAELRYRCERVERLAPPRPH